MTLPILFFFLKITFDLFRYSQGGNNKANKKRLSCLLLLPDCNLQLFTDVRIIMRSHLTETCKNFIITSKGINKFCIYKDQDLHTSASSLVIPSFHA